MPTDGVLKQLRILGNIWCKRTVFIFLTPKTMEDLLPIAKGKKSIIIKDHNYIISSRFHYEPGYDMCSVYSRLFCVLLLLSWECQFSLYLIHFTHTYLAYIFFLFVRIQILLLLIYVIKNVLFFFSFFLTQTLFLILKDLFLASGRVRVADV